ncbi:hypothetical protein HRI_004073900 [Hibiscus trionum]|uniref:RRM domain-containing protein n=1 Tax=Hibiscus trionum TaxID=183268 RepID=A0A9W7MKM2_HIBTR|nr:hypothetical protein HRI_004073900 [Hibiscus trionum]
MERERENGSGRVNQRRRRGVSVFINYVSRRIHHQSLGEAFRIYGSVVDVFIAYNNLKRLGKPTTFAFVRFKDVEGANKAVMEANGRRMDGYRIKVDFAKPATSGNTMRKNHRSVRKQRDFRSFKEVLLGVERSEHFSAESTKGVSSEKQRNQSNDTSVQVINLVQSVGVAGIDKRPKTIFKHNEIVKVRRRHRKHS